MESENGSSSAAATTEEKIKGLSATDNIDGTGMRIAVLYTRWNEKVVGALKDGCKDQLIKRGVAEEDILFHQVPGSYELPLAAQKYILHEKVDAVVCIGCLIKGGTMHFEYICEAVSRGIMDVGLTTGVPVIFGVLTCLTEAQALERAGLIEGHHNHGPEWGDAAISMAQMCSDLEGKKSRNSRKRKST